jgi:hypothetical protein
MLNAIESSSISLSGRRRSKQVLEAQHTYRARKRNSGFRRIQEWVPDETLAQLRKVAHDTGLSRAQLLEQLVACAFSGKIDIKGAKDDNR